MQHYQLSTLHYQLLHEVIRKLPTVDLVSPTDFVFSITTRKQTTTSEYAIAAFRRNDACIRNRGVNLRNLGVNLSAGSQPFAERS
ncbi:MAG: hypothetical protein LBC20_09835 [Planctomycetaceae bacterium]|nr:hypothetical protein [Planctomycetaceae bacterium]